MCDKRFLKKVLEISETVCGTEYVTHLADLRGERERLLNNVWKKDKDNLSFSAQKKELILREVDFDTIVYFAVKYVDEKAYADLLFQLAKTAITYGQFKKAENLLTSVVEKHSSSLPQDKIAEAHYTRGKLYFYKNNLDASYRSYTRALDIYQQLKSDLGVAVIKNVIGALKVEDGLTKEGEACFTEAMQLAEQLNDVELQIKVEMNLGNLYHIKGDGQKAHDTYQKACTSYFNDVTEESRSLILLNLAIAQKTLKQYKEAAENVAKALESVKLTNNRHHKGLVYLIQAELALLEKDYSTATAYVTTAFSIFSEIGDRRSVAEVYKILGMINRDSGKYEVALSYLENAIRISRELDDRLNLGEAYIELALLLRQTGKVADTLNAFSSAEQIFIEIGADKRVALIQIVKDELKL